MLEHVWNEFRITSLHDWQVECLSLPSVKAGGNIIFSAPTSAGKSIVCDLFYLRTLLENPGKTVIFVLPFVSLIAEKEKHLKALCESMNLKFSSLHSHKRANFSAEDPPNLILCTVEKAN
jgi:DNA polymerase theta